MPLAVTRDLRALANQRDANGKHPMVIAPDQFSELFSDLSTNEIVDGKIVTREYRFGDPRIETAPVYHMSSKLVEGRPLISYSDEAGRIKPFITGLISIHSWRKNKRENDLVNLCVGKLQRIVLVELQGYGIGQLASANHLFQVFD